MLQNRFLDNQIMQPSPVLSLSPSFNSYSSSRLADIAARVVEEFRGEANYDGDGFDYANSFLTDYGESFHGGVIENEKVTRENVGNNFNEEKKDEDEEEEFEFAVVGRDFVSSPAPADEIFYNGQIKPYYPLFNRDLLLESVEIEKGNENLSYQKSTQETAPAVTAARLSLRKLFIEDREPPSSCSSSEADELDGVQPGSYCVWSPKAAGEEPASAAKARCKKSNSTGSSKRWRFRDLVHRSNSDGKDSFVFLTHPNHQDNRNGKRTEEKVEKIEKSTAVAPEVPKAAGKVTAVAAYMKNDGERRRMSFLPYRQDLLGVFSNVNGLSRNLHPF